MIGPADLANRFQYHKPDDAKARRHTTVRDTMHRAAEAVDETCHDGREKSLAITKLEEAMYWANAAIARET